MFDTSLPVSAASRTRELNRPDAIQAAYLLIAVLRSLLLLKFGDKYFFCTSLPSMQVCCLSLCLGDLHNAHIALSLTFWAFGAPFPVFLLRTSPARKRGSVSADYGGSRTEIQRQYIAVKCFLSPEKWPWCHFSGYKTYMGPPTRKARSAPTHRKKFHSIKGKREWDINYKIGINKKAIA